MVNINIKKTIFYIVLILSTLVVVRVVSIFYSGDIVLSEENTTILEGQWVSNKKMTLKSFKKMDYLKDYLGKMKYTINGSQFTVEIDDTKVTMYFRVNYKSEKEISIEFFHSRLTVFGMNVLFFSINKDTYLLFDNCILPKKSTEYFCK